MKNNFIRVWYIIHGCNFLNSEAQFGLAQIETRQVVVDWHRCRCAELLSCTFAFYLYCQDFIPCLEVNIWKFLGCHPSQQSSEFQNDVIIVWSTFSQKMCREIWYTQYNHAKIFHQKTLQVQVKALVTFLSYKE